MGRVFKMCAVLGCFTLGSFCPAQGPLGITISVHDYADVSTATLAKAEAEARRIFQQAGVQTTWLNCSPKLERQEREPAGCSLADSTRLVLKILHSAKNTRVGKDIDVLGTALLQENRANYYAYAYYDRIQQVTESHKVGYGLLCAVLVQEIGHLLLQSNSHSPTGIMCARWSDEELRRISEGIMYFNPTDSGRMHARIEQMRLSMAKGRAFSAVMQ